MRREKIKTKEQARQYARERMMQEIERIKKLQSIEDIDEREKNENWREPLAVSKGYTITIELSTGGDADGFILQYDKDKELTGGVYYWADWGFYEEITLRMKEARLIEEIYLAGDGSSFL